jgi:hypothetical protein
MEMSQRNSLYSYKNVTFFYKIREEEGRTGLAWGIGTNERGEDVGGGCRRVNMV